MKESSILAEIRAAYHKRSRMNQPVMNLSYKKAVNGEMSELGAESTTIGLTSIDGESPLIGKRQGLSLDADRQLNTVSEYPGTASLHEYRKRRLLKKGSPKLMKMVK